jgi:hypothetical protein
MRAMFKFGIFPGLKQRKVSPFSSVLLRTLNTETLFDQSFSRRRTKETKTNIIMFTKYN